ncbi:MAG: hypothetical protein HOH77_08460, partial [Candidatus Latescibacteria bacterium]|nr:hypothetical protein [Candidatus Latescibacterota bacterium]
MNQSYYVFGLRGKKYAILTESVKETHWLPKLTPLEEAPMYVPGVFNLRGEIVPVIDLERRLGYPSRSYLPEEKVVTIFWESGLMGLIVADIFPLQQIEDTQIEAAPQYGLPERQVPAYIQGIAKVDGDILMVLDLDVVFGGAQIDVGEVADVDSNLVSEADGGDSHAALFLARAKHLREHRRLGQGQGNMPLAVVQIGTERLGFILEKLRSFV